MSTLVEILLVEDNPNDVELTMRAFTRHKLANRVHVARDGQEALDFLFCEGPYAGRSPDGRPKVVLLDLKLPKVNGVEVLRRLRADPRTSTLPVVVVTSSGEDIDLSRCYALGVNSYIVKPVDFERFSTALGEIGMYWAALNQLPPQ